MWVTVAWDLDCSGNGDPGVQFDRLEARDAQKQDVRGRVTQQLRGREALPVIQQDPLPHLPHRGEAALGDPAARARKPQAGPGSCLDVVVLQEASCTAFKSLSVKIRTAGSKAAKCKPELSLTVIVQEHFHAAPSCAEIGFLDGCFLSICGNVQA